VIHKITKVGAGYVYREGSNYRCRECVHFMADKERCFLLGPAARVGENWYCIMWAQGKTPFISLRDWAESYRPSEVGLGNLKNGTQCRRCEHFNGSHSCEIVEGSIDPGGCCDSQTPK